MTMFDSLFSEKIEKWVYLNLIYLIKSKIIIFWEIKKRSKWYII